jgi:hypothetical protein
MSDFFPPAPVTDDRPPDLSCQMMADIETLATEADAPILSIGAVVFDPQRQNTFEELRARSFLRLVDVEDALKHTPRISGSTLKWWFSQDDAAIKNLINGGQVTLFQALADFNRYATDRSESSPLPAPYRSLAPCEVIWANSPSFDCVIMEHSCRVTKAPWPFRFYNWRDVRTIIDLAWPNGPDDRPDITPVVAHDARDDAVAQAMKVQAAYAALGLGT